MLYIVNNIPTDLGHMNTTIYMIVRVSIPLMLAYGLIIDIWKSILASLVEHCKIHFTASSECLLIRPPSRFEYIVLWKK